MTFTPSLTAPGSGVSILVFVELALDVAVGGILGKTYIGFQSLFSWNLLLMRNVVL